MILYSSLTYKGAVIPLRTAELTYISSPGTVGLPGHWSELSGQSQCVCRACKAPTDNNKAHKEKKRPGKRDGGKFEEEPEGELVVLLFVSW